MEDTWRFDVGFMEALKAPVFTLADAGLTEVPWRFDVGFMEVLKALYLYLLVLSCSLTDGILMEVPWRTHGGLM